MDSIFWVSLGKIRPFWGVFWNFLHTQKKSQSFLNGSCFLIFFLLLSINWDCFPIQGLFVVHVYTHPNFLDRCLPIVPMCEKKKLEKKMKKKEKLSSKTWTTTFEVLYNSRNKKTEGTRAIHHEYWG